jgi:hypothetical protein
LAAILSVTFRNGILEVLNSLARILQLLDKGIESHDYLNLSHTHRRCRLF